MFKNAASLSMEFGARGRNRTGMESPPRDFRTSYGFRRAAAKVTWRLCGLDFLFVLSSRQRLEDDLDEGRQVSTLSGCGLKPRLGLARDCHRLNRAEVSPSLTLFTYGRFRPACSIFQVPCVYLFHHPGADRRISPTSRVCTRPGLARHRGTVFALSEETRRSPTGAAIGPNPGRCPSDRPPPREYPARADRIPARRGPRPVRQGRAYPLPPAWSV